MTDMQFTLEADVSFFGDSKQVVDVSLKPDGSATLSSSGVTIAIAEAQVSLLEEKLEAHRKARAA